MNQENRMMELIALQLACSQILQDTNLPNDVEKIIRQYLGKLGDENMYVKTRAGLWKCEISCGIFSDRRDNFIVVRANNYEEAKNAIKLFLNQTKDHPYSSENVCIIDDEEIYQYEPKGKDYKLKRYANDEVDFDYTGFIITISELDVIYPGLDLAPPSL